MQKSFIPHVDIEGMRKAIHKVNTWLSDVFARFSGKKITVETEVKGGEQIEQAKQKLDLLGQAVKQLPDPPVTRWSKMTGVFSSLHSGIKNFVGGLKEVTGYLVSSGGGALILMEGFKSLAEMGNHFCNSWVQRMKEAATSDQNLSRILETAQTN